MCGRLTLHTPESRIREAFNLEHSEALGLKSRYNIAPSQQILIVRNTVSGRKMVRDIQFHLES
jgi:putative SOS response-associated peptidase YedK